MRKKELNKTNFEVELSRYIRSLLVEGQSAITLTELEEIWNEVASTGGRVRIAIGENSYRPRDSGFFCQLDESKVLIGI